MNEMRKAVITVLGVDKKGIIARVSAILYQNDVNITDISQTIISGLFSMVMTADISSEKCEFGTVKTLLTELGQDMNLQIRIQRAEIFEAMYQV